MPKVGGKRKKTKTHLDEAEELPSSVPRCKFNIRIIIFSFGFKKR